MYCKKCSVKVSGGRKYCPLCQNPLTDDGSDKSEIFPVIPTVYKKYRLFFQLLIFGSICLCVASVLINIFTFTGVRWSFFVVLGVICLWISLFIAVQKRRNIPKNLVYQIFFASVISLVWDKLTGWHNWALDWAIPCFCIGAMIAMGILYIVLSIKVQDFIIFFFVNILFGIVPTVFMLTGLVKNSFASILCVGLSIISFAALIIFQGHAMIAELKKRFHM